MNISLRSSQSSYGDPRYLSTQTVSDVHAPQSKGLVDGYRDALDPQHGDRSRFNPLNSAHPRSSVLLNTSDPITMYLLTETAMGDSTNFEILSFEEVEDLKKERSLLSTRIDGTKRKLALETKLRDAAQSIGRLYSPPSPRSSGEYGSKSHRRSRSIFGRSGTDEVLDKSDSELATSQRKCEELAQELWKLERRSQQINQRLLEHTAAVLQLTHKGLKKTSKAGGSRDSGNPYDAHDFDDRSLYRTPEHMDNYGLKGRIDTGTSAGAGAVSTEAMQAMEKRLEGLSERMCDMMVHSNPDEFVDPPPKSHAHGPADLSASVEAYLAYIENNLASLPSQMSQSPLPGQGAKSVAPGPAPEAEGAWRQQITEVNTRVQSIVDRFGLTRSPTLPPPPTASDGEGLEEQLSYLQTGIDGLESRVDGLLEQKSILTTQIQQQRELNSKSDAERDAHIGDLTEQLHKARKDHELAERNGKSAQEELTAMNQQLEAMRHDGSSQHEAQAALVQAEGEVARLQSVVESLHREADARSEEVQGIQDRADQEVAEVKASIQQTQSEAEARLNEAIEQRTQAEENASRLQNEMTELEGEVVRITTELTMVKAELDGAYGTRAQRAAEVAANPEMQKQNDALTSRNIELTEELAALKGQRGGGDLQQRADTLEKELRETLDDYEAMTKASIEFEKERERFEGVIDSLRDRCEQLETQLSEERINWMNLNSPTGISRDPTSETTSTMVLKNEFKKMMRDTRIENMKILKAEQEERRRIEGLLRALRKEHSTVTGKPMPSPVGTPL
ncbi:hypothetical protein N7492_001293 [Penicillium capsulatum]|uniref:Up-regulated during septation protein 1 domain-containing protein n=1 Tax=Penicillium capsulatum TaxID=69766 RepID=A0A9W9ITD9_9EURO|nr:hypothetical protein N7492_001293 [Penicillium capsulatum]KAJ6129648.1 hypothetical protein N7512_002428 [Penicillium capsulatum]